MVFTKSGPKYSGRKGSYVGHHWFDDIEVIPDEDRVMPMTVPHEVIAEHWITCGCVGCRAYPVEVQRRLKMEKLKELKRARLSAARQQ